MNLKFTDQNLQDIKTVAGASEWGLRDAFFWWGGIPKYQQVQTCDVENFAIAFMTQYNERFGRTY